MKVNPFNKFKIDAEQNQSINNSIFRSYDIRGIYPQKLNEETAYLIGGAFVNYTKAKKVVVGRDMRISSLSLFEALCRGITDAGSDVYDIGKIPTEILYFTVGRYEYGGGIMITASHNPKEYNGFKLIKKESYGFSMIRGKDLYNTINEDNYPSVKEKCKIKNVQITIDGSQKLHNFNRPLKSGGDSYLRILKNLTKIPNSMKLLIRINIDKAIFNSLGKLFQDLSLFKIWPQNARSVLLYLGHKQYYDMNNQLDDKSKYYSNEEYAIAEEKFRELKLKFYNVWANENNYKISKLAFWYPKFNPFCCKTVNSPYSFVIDHNGNITKCWCDCSFEYKTIINIQEGFNALLKKTNFQKYLSFNHFKYDQECSDCKYLPICESGNCYHRHTEEGQIKPCTTWKYKLENVLKKQYLLSIDQPEIIQPYSELFSNNDITIKPCE